ncbi:MAG: sigma-70 family RNA polymerase sigma factor [bacterium]|nr:sigma-70 family RNA polymerase sigma factor [bacterium]
MKTQTQGFQGSVLDGGRTIEAEDSVHFRELINQHLSMVERQCFKAIRRQLTAAGYGNPGINNPVNIENESLELSNLVLDTLQREDYRVLRQFKGNSKLSTYIITIIARQAVDMVRKKRGRNREKERAQSFGEIGLLVYEKMVLQGCPVTEIHAHLKTEKGISQSIEEIEVMADKIKGNKIGNPANSIVRDAAPGKEGENGGFVIADNEKDPAELLIEEQRTHQVSRVVKTIIDGLDGEEQLVLRMRFPVDHDQKPGKVSTIAKRLGITEKAAYKRIARLLKKCRAILEQEGVSLDELL